MYPSKPAHGQFPNPVIEFTAFEFPVRNGQRPVEEPDFWRPHHVFCVEHEFHGAGFKTRPATFGHSQFPATSVVQSVLKLPPERSLIEKALQQTARKKQPERYRFRYRLPAIEDGLAKESDSKHAIAMPWEVSQYDSSPWHRHLSYRTCRVCQFNSFPRPGIPGDRENSPVCTGPPGTLVGRETHFTQTGRARNW